VLHYIEEKGVSYFTKRNARALAALESLADLEFVDQRTLFDALSAFDTYDIAKLVASTPDTTITDKLFSVMTEARKNEVSWVMRRDLKVDPLEVQDIEQRLIAHIKTIKTAAAPAHS
jgi:hypothetical protein